MTINKIIKSKMRDVYFDTFTNVYGAKNPEKKLSRKIVRKRMKQDKFYNGFKDFVEENRKKN